MLVCTLGDLVLDVIVRLQQPLAPGGDATSTITVGAGGQAANVAAWVAALGGRARWLGVQATDDVGRLAQARLAAYGVELCGPPVRRAWRRDRLARRSRRRTHDVPGPWRRGRAASRRRSTPPGSRAAIGSMCPAMRCSSSRCGRRRFGPSRRRVRAQARVSVDLSSWSGIRDAGVGGVSARCSSGSHPTSSSRTRTRHAPSASGRPERSGSRSAARQGARSTATCEPPLAVEHVVDTTGAGDALAAGWLVGGPDLALEAAARCVGRVGAMP